MLLKSTWVIENHHSFPNLFNPTLWLTKFSFKNLQESQLSQLGAPREDFQIWTWHVIHEKEDQVRSYFLHLVPSSDYSLRLKKQWVSWSWLVHAEKTCSRNISGCRKQNKTSQAINTSLPSLASVSGKLLGLALLLGQHLHPHLLRPGWICKAKNISTWEEASDELIDW